MSTKDLSADEAHFDQMRVDLPPEEWRAFQAALDHPEVAKPKLKALLSCCAG